MMHTDLQSTFSQLPKIPGMGFGEELLRGDYRKPQLMDPKQGVKDKPTRAALQPYDNMRLANTQLGTTAQKKMTLDRKVLRFQGYFREGVHESRIEQVCVAAQWFVLSFQERVLPVAERFCSA